MKKDNLPNSHNLRKSDRLRLKEKTKLVDEFIDSVEKSKITEDNKLVKWGGISYHPIFKNKRNKKQGERRTILEKKN